MIYPGDVQVITAVKPLPIIQARIAAMISWHLDISTSLCYPISYTYFPEPAFIFHSGLRGKCTGWEHSAYSTLYSVLQVILGVFQKRNSFFTIFFHIFCWCEGVKCQMPPSASREMLQEEEEIKKLMERCC